MFMFMSSFKAGVGDWGGGIEAYRTKIFLVP